MEIDRRNLLTGLATSTAAAMLPAMPAAAALSEVGRLYFREGFIITKTRFDRMNLRGFILGSLWHFDPCDGDTWLIRHVELGMICRRAPQVDDRFALEALSLNADRACWPERALTFAGQGARFAALHASLVLGCRPWHEGAVFFHYPQVDPSDPYNLPLTEDAPPLSPDSPSGPPRGNRTVLPSDLSGFFPSDA